MMLPIQAPGVERPRLATRMPDSQVGPHLMVQSAVMTTRERCIACGCVAEWLNCRCSTDEKFECATRKTALSQVLVMA
jgi:hypothetical protein